MGKIVGLISTYRNLIVYIIFAFISLRLVYGYSYHHQNAFLRTSSEIVQGLSSRTQSLRNYIDLKDQNERLRIELAKANMKLSRSKISLQGEDKQALDSNTIMRFHFQDARVINKSLVHTKNYFTLNKGSEAGVKKNDGVITPLNEMVGKVIDVSDHFSLVMPIIHNEIKLRVKLSHNDKDGILSWNGESLDVADLSEIGKRVSVEVGDSVVSSSSSLFFPEDVYVGSISSINESGDVKSIKVNLSTDFQSLNHVFITSNVLLNEQLELEDGLIENGSEE